MWAGLGFKNAGSMEVWATDGYNLNSLKGVV